MGAAGGEGAEVSRFEEIAAEIGALVTEKNKSYGDSFRRSGEFLSILYPNGIAPAQYRAALAMIRVIDKLFRIATRKDAFGESPWKDVCGYSILSIAAEETERATGRAEQGDTSQKPPIHSAEVHGGPVLSGPLSCATLSDFLYQNCKGSGWMDASKIADAFASESSEGILEILRRDPERVAVQARISITHAREISKSLIALDKDA